MSRPSFQLEGSVCLLTGASSGIGRALAHLLAAAGAHLVLQGRNEQRLLQVAEETGADSVALDLTVPGGPEFLFGEAKRLRGRVDVLVNNAGAGWAGAFVDMPFERVNHIIALNLLVPMALTQAALPDMLSANRGRIVFVASIAGYLGVRDEAVYSASKAAIIAFAESLRAETTGTAIAASVVSPAVIDTPFFGSRGRPYTRSWPRPLPPVAAAKAICHAIEDGKAETVLPSSMWGSIRLKALLPFVYRALADRFA